MFKINDRVFACKYGDGIVISSMGDNDYPILVEFESGTRDCFTRDGKQHKTDLYPMLSHVNYSESIIITKPFNLKDHIGKLCLFWDNEKTLSVVSYLRSINEGDKFPYKIARGGTYKYCELLSEDALKALGL